jgi:hypothetical protein
LKNKIPQNLEIRVGLDKIEGRDSKREVVCIHFNHPAKKNGLG